VHYEKEIDTGNFRFRHYTTEKDPSRSKLKNKNYSDHSKPYPKKNKK